MFDLNGGMLFSVHGGGDSGGMADLLVDLLTALEGLLALPSGELFAAIFPGIAAMDNIHPLFVHFPIALLSIFFLIDLTASVKKKPDWRRVASWFLYLGALFAGLTVLAGFSAASTVVHGEDVHEIMETHEHFGVAIFSLASVLSLWRLLSKGNLTGGANYLYLILAGLMSVLIVFAADLGGLMVYKNGVAVAAVQARHSESSAEELHRHSH